MFTILLTQQGVLCIVSIRHTNGKYLLCLC